MHTDIHIPTAADVARADWTQIDPVTAWNVGRHSVPSADIHVRTSYLPTYGAYETLVDGPAALFMVIGSGQVRYDTRAEAQDGHKRFVEAVTAWHESQVTR